MVGHAVNVVLLVAEIGGQSEDPHQLLDRAELPGQRIGGDHRGWRVRGSSQPVGVDVGIEMSVARGGGHGGLPAVNHAKW